MAVGKFEGVSEAQWEVLTLLLPPAPEKRGQGMPHTAWRWVVNTILSVLITGCRWGDVPQEPPWAPRSTAHRWLGRWQREGLWQRVLHGILAMAELAGLIAWESSAIDGSFSPRQRRRRRGEVWAQRQGRRHAQSGSRGGTALGREYDSRHWG